MYFVYLLRCADKSLYTGITNNIERRLAAHRAGTASRYTRSRGALSFEYIEKKNTKGSALKREAAIKRLPREKKLQLIQESRRITKVGDSLKIR